MVYMVAGDSDKLDTLAVQDLQEMENGVRENDDVEVYVQVHRKWPETPQRYHIKMGEPATSMPRKQPGPVSMANGKTLREFLQDAPEAENYCLVLWGHSYGLGFGREHGDKLMLSELRDALGAFETQPEIKRKRLDLLGANTCTLAYAEAIYELRDSAQFMIASEVFVPFAGWPYQEILSNVHEQKPDELGSLIANRYVDFYNTPDRDERVAMTLLDLSKVKTPAHSGNRPMVDLAKAIEDLGEGIKTAIDGIVKADKKNDQRNARLQRIQDAFLINPAGQIRPVLDLRGLANDLTGACDEIVLCENGGPKSKNKLSELRTAADAVESILKDPPNTLPPPGEGRKLVLLLKAHPELSDLNGVGIFAPFVVESRLSRSELDLVGKTEEQLKQQSLKDYLQLAVFDRHTGSSKKPAGEVTPDGISKNATWPDLVFGDLRPNRPAEIVDGTGLVRPDQRSAVSHMVFAVDAAFRRLDRALPLSQERLAETLKKKLSDRSRLRNIACFGPPYLKLARDRSLGADRKNFGKKPPDPREPIPIVKALQSIENAFSRVERITRRVVTDAQFGIGPAASPATDRPGGGFVVKPIGAGFLEKPIGAGFLEKPIGAGFLEKPIGAGFAEKPIGAGFAEKPIGAGFGETDDTANQVGSQIAFMTADQGLGALATIHLLVNIARSFNQVELAIVGLEDEVATLLENPKFGAILSETDYTKAVQTRIQRRFAVLQEACLQALRVVRQVLAHPTFGLGPGPESIGRGDREALAAHAGLSRQGLLLL